MIAYYFMKEMFNYCALDGHTGQQLKLVSFQRHNLQIKLIKYLGRR